MEYMWQVLEVSEDEEIVSTVMQKHIEMGWCLSVLANCS